MKKLYLLGHPVAHSLSPKIHNTASRLLGLSYHYDLLDVTEAQLSDTLKILLRDPDCVGFNLTMPLKRTILPLLDEISPQGQLAQSVNTVKISNGQLYGHTTDGEGFFDFLLADGHDLKGKKIVVLGAGGAANSIICEGAYRALSEIAVYKRKNDSFDRAAAFLSGIAEKTGTPIRLTDLADERALRADLAEAALLVNATSVGMAPDIDRTILDASYFRTGLIVSDIVYNPLETRFLREAGEAGCITYNGTYMLLYQAAAAYRLWTGADMPVQEVQSLLGALSDKNDLDRL